MATTSVLFLQGEHCQSGLACPPSTGFVFLSGDTELRSAEECSPAGWQGHERSSGRLPYGLESFCPQNRDLVAETSLAEYTEKLPAATRRCLEDAVDSRVAAVSPVDSS